MAKYFTPVWLDGLSGLLDGVVFAEKPRILPTLKGTAPAGWIRKFVYAVATGALVQNIQETFTLLSVDWKAMSATDQITWNDEAGIRSQALGYDVTGRMLFFSYFLTKLTHGLSVNFKPATLAAGSGSDYANRGTRQFTSDIT